jgi:hypothetical protein
MLEVLDKSESAVLVRFGSELGTQHFIFGKDGAEGRPFTTQVGRKIKTLADAFDFLMPKIVKEAIAQGLDVKRQGDWFFIPIEEPENKRSCIRHCYWTADRRVDAEPDPHILYFGYSFNETRHTVNGKIIFRAIGRHYVQGIVSAPDHPNLILGEEWHLAVRRNSLPWEYSRGRQRGDD